MPKAGTEYDYVIVGAGSAGCVLANRLTADGTTTVLLLEAGGKDSNPLIHIPLGFSKIHEYRMHDWGYDHEAEPGVANRQIEAMRGKVLGGSSSINVMAYVRGHRGDYDRWSANGATGWSFAETLPYFKRGENWEGGETKWRGGGGPLMTRMARSDDPLNDAWMGAGQRLGLGWSDDYNGAQQEGLTTGQFSIGRGRRSSAATAYLRPVLARRNLTLALKQLVTRIVIENGKAVGVEYGDAGALHQVRAARAVIVSSGVFNSPQLLMLSGIGPAAHLKEIGIKTLVDLPVGNNLQDHMVVLMEWMRTAAPSRFRGLMRFDRMAGAMMQAHFLGSGRATELPGVLFGFIKTRSSSVVPDLQFYFRGAPSHAHLWFPGIKPPYADGFGMRPCVLHPKSRGAVRLRSADPRDSVRIHGNFFSEPDDLATLSEGVRRIRELAAQPELDAFRGAEIKPGPSIKGGAEMEAWIRKTTITAHHPAGTCAMGMPGRGVVDPTLRVHGIDNLRVVDASVMPDLVSGNINAATLMIAEKAADMIQGMAPLPRAEV